MQRIFRGPLIWVIIVLVALVLMSQFAGQSTGYQQVPTSRVVQILDGTDKIDTVEMQTGEQRVLITMADAKQTKYSSYWAGNQDDQMIARLNERVAQQTLTSWNATSPRPGFWAGLLNTLIPFLLLGGLFFFLLNAMQGGGSQVMKFGKSRAKVANKDTPKTTFADVAGCEEAIEELQEIKEFLAEPAKFQRVGAKIPKGVLLYGPPGTGKTLLARAVAGEAGVPFFSISGSDFVEMFVGVGASRVRDLFEQAKENRPAIIFIDEIDAVGRHRGAGMGGGHDEREQTLNQLLVEMDGFDVHGEVILIAATNRPDVLDPALLRPGRFDRQIPVEAPDMKGREKILQVHSAGKPMAPDVNLSTVAQRTPGFTGADLANVLNEAALLTARNNAAMITNSALDEAIDRVIAGPQKRTRLMNEHERLVTAYHEGGHALVAAAMPGTDPVQKVTILPRGRALGYTMVMPDADKYSQTRGQLLDQLAYMLGGRAAEELVFHDPSTGASNDIDKATKTARAMVTEYGMSQRIGAVKLGTGDSEPFLGRDFGSQRDYSEHVAGIVDQEVADLVGAAHQEAFDCLEENRAVLDELVRQLFEKETLGREEVEKIFEPLKRHPERGAWTGSDTRRPSEIPPITPPQKPITAAPVPAPLPVGGIAPVPVPPVPVDPNWPAPQPPAGWVAPQAPGTPQGPMAPQSPGAPQPQGTPQSLAPQQPPAGPWQPPAPGAQPGPWNGAPTPWQSPDGQQAPGQAVPGQQGPTTPDERQDGPRG
ncbi:ATP-dependent zinc metalloprotease FtsH [Raineyella sp. LH-20]|uniref:ATP-dependent zinc metalloprotease FtsH n=1 Tax=Raineyella sp. LH-20 TaxID=3081204 RepID=UPI00295561A8|nr:ATP-dependent zinc metalloprotease FtsH [Raineyella sp. LH-20]WOP17244.1 ATP-dependent zinc metalloprotease FtsH [Raineyella sp. LH-20]